MPLVLRATVVSPSDGVEVMVGHGHAHYAVQSTGVFCTADDTLYVTDTDARFEHP